LPCLTVSRAEHGINPEDEAGYVLSAPRCDPPFLANATQAAQNGAPLLLLGRADSFASALLQLADTELQQDPAGGAGGGLPAGMYPLEGGDHNMSLSRYTAVTAKESLASVRTPQGKLAPVATIGSRSPSVVWAQLNDEHASEDLSLGALGSVEAVFRVAQATNRAAAQQGQPYLEGVSFERPVTMHAWRSHGTVKILMGTLESPFCGAGGCSFPSEFLNANVTLVLAPARLGVPLTEPPRLRCLDGALPDVIGIVSLAGLVRFPVFLPPGNGHAFELL